MLYKRHFSYRLNCSSECKCSLDSEISVKIHGAIMNNIVKELADYLHISELHPFSLYSKVQNNSFNVCVNALTDKASALIDCLTDLHEIHIYGCQQTAKLISYKSYEPVLFSELGNSSSDIIQAQIVTPAIYRSAGKIQNLPVIEKYLHSVICKINKFENQNICDNDIITALENSVILSYSFTDKSFKLNGIHIKGMIGKFRLKLPKDTKQADLLKKVLYYSTYSGTGAKTGLGMGAVNIL